MPTAGVTPAAADKKNCIPIVKIMVLIIISALVAIISTACALSLRSRLRKEEGETAKIEDKLAVYSRLLDLDTMPSEVSYLAEHLMAKREKEAAEAAERRRQFLLQEEERKGLCIKRQVGEQRVCRTCGTQLEHWGPAGYYSPEYMGVSCPSCKWSCNIKRILPPSGMCD